MFLWQELSQVKAAALTERGQAEEELIKVRNQARLEEVRTRSVCGPCLCGKECIWLPSMCFCSVTPRPGFHWPAHSVFSEEGVLKSLL